MRRLLVLVVLLCTLLLSSCASDKRNEALTNTLSAYASVVRWGDFGSALQFIDPKVRDQHMPTQLEMSRFDQFRVTGYDDGGGPAAGGENEVRQVVAISMVNNNTQAERTVIDRQTWRYDPQTNHWWLLTGLPDLTAEQ